MPTPVFLTDPTHPDYPPGSMDSVGEADGYAGVPGGFLCTSDTRPAALQRFSRIYEHDTRRVYYNSGTTHAPVWTLIAEPRPAWIAPTLLNGWLNFGAPFAATAYLKDTVGFVHLKGTLKSGTMNTAMFTLPLGYRPAEDELVPADSGGSYGRVRVNADGTVVPTHGTNAAMSINSIVFRAVQ